MDAQLRIDSDEACRLAEDLAHLTGEDVTTAVVAALRQRLERERDIQERLRRVRALAAEIRAAIDGPVSSADHNDLYGPDGLPA